MFYPKLVRRKNKEPRTRWEENLGDDELLHQPRRCARRQAKTFLAYVSDWLSIYQPL